MTSARFDGPQWFNPKGREIKISYKPAANFLLIGNSKNTRLTVKPEERFKNKVAFGVSWHIHIKKHPRHLREWVGGNRYFSRNELFSAFGVPGAVTAIDTDHHTLARMNGADVACPGLFIRQGNYLNIPGPSSGFAFDTAMSIEVTDEIRDAIRKIAA